MMNNKTKGGGKNPHPLRKKAVATGNESSTRCRQLKVYTFGNEDLGFDKRAFEVAKEIKKKNRNVDFMAVKPNEDLPFDNKHDVVIMDVVEGLAEVKLIENDELEKIVPPPRTTAHDFDLGFQLKYLKKLGKLGRVTLIGLPMHGVIDYKRIHSIFKKLVAQDIQGS